ncbi:benzoate-CoA ligase family protein [Magnetospirillum fulvum]|uniref:Benzoate-CoA ligase n=1 Tax=Magnetospirillum fulvum TaxID=1082 RepID=A0A1H6HDG9_MAGFU|nr:benzoate-CoA ligase family protein [Magnetospirillum fulvum]SEH33869.1 benzoate-CoA ligase [Magnetospirillum fulvum]
MSMRQSGLASDAQIDFPPGFNVAEHFIDRHLDDGRGSKVAIRSNRGQVTYSELAIRVNRAAHALSAMGLGRGDRVLMVLKDSPDFFYLFWGAIKAGIVPVPVNTLLRRKDYAYMIDNSECSVLAYSAEYGTEVEAALSIATHAPATLLKFDGTAEARLFETGAETFKAVPASATDECFWLYSSGSTGRPKAAVHLHRDMVVTSEFYGVRTLGITVDDVFFSAAKLFFAYGLGNGMTFPLWVGGTAVLLEERPTPHSTFDIIERFRPSLYFGVPTLYASQLQVIDEIRPDLSSIRLCVSAGEALPADIFRRWQERTGTVILDGIGSTEALHIFISNREGKLKPGSSGTLVPGYEAMILDDNDQKVKDGEIGRLIIKGDSTAKYYWRDPEKTAATMMGEWLNTGDSYYRDEDGYFYYCGRSDDMLKVGGIWCSPFEIEATLVEHPAVLEVAVVGRSDPEGLVKPEAWIVLAGEATPDKSLEDDLQSHCKARMAPYKFPRTFHFVDELPKTATGKIQRFRLRLDAQ